jgi:hypothetical protein
MASGGVLQCPFVAALSGRATATGQCLLIGE